MKKTTISLLCLLLFTGLISAQNLPSYLPSNGLVGWWPFNGNANDQSGNNLSSTNSGISFISDRSGNTNSAIAFAGSGSVKTPFSQQISPANFPNYSISLWFRRIAHNENGRMILQFKEGELGPAGTSNFDFHESRSDWCNLNKPSFYHFPYWPSYACSPTIPSLGSWHHAALLFSQTTDSVRLYLNGNYWFSSVVNNDFPGSGYLIFGNNASDEFAFTGDLDDIAVYNRALSQQEITVLYQGGNSSTACPELPPNLQQGLKGYWPFCGNANDESGNGNNGSIYGATLATDRFGNSNKAFSFDGNSRIKTPINNSTLDLNRNLSLAFWTKQSNVQGDNQVFIWRGDSQGGFDPYGFCRCGDQFAFRRNVGTDGQLELVDFSKNQALTDTWIHLAGTFDSTSSKMRIYLNGQLMAERNVPNPIQYSTAGFITQFGGVEDYPGLLGNLDDIAIWNRALSPEEITQLYAIQSCGTPLTVNINASGTLSANPGAGIQIQAQTNLDSTRWQWQAEVAEMGWNNLSNNARYHGIDSSKLRVTGIKISNHLQKFRVVGKSGACADTSGTVVLQVTDTCITSISDTSFVTITDTSFITIYDTNTTTVYDTNLVTVTDTLIINTIITAGNPGVKNTLKAYPNPTAGILYINNGNFSTMTGYSIRISSASGQLVYESAINQALLEVPLENFGANGLYYLRLFKPSGELITTRKIVLQQ